MLKRIKYSSRFARPLDDDEITALGERSAKKNADRDITGVLMTTGGVFFQTIEGPPDEIDALYRRIAADERHTDVLLLDVEEGALERQFADWAMVTVNLDANEDVSHEPLRMLLATIFEQRRLAANLTKTLERALYHQLSDTQ